LHPDGSFKLGTDGLPIRTYDLDDITELSRVFTGWGLSVRNPDSGHKPGVEENADFTFTGHNVFNNYHPYWAEALKMFEDNGVAPDHGEYVLYHDNGEKNVMGTMIPAGQTGEAELAQVMALLSNHSNTAPFISYRLIQRLVTSNPSAGYLYRVSTVFKETGGDLATLLKAILLDPEARNLSFQDWDGYGKKKEPLVHFTAMLRLIQAYPSGITSYPITDLADIELFAELGQKYEPWGNQDIYIGSVLPASEFELYEDGAEMLFLQSDMMQDDDVGFQQTPLRAPTVFNWFLPNYAPIGVVSSAGLVAPELQIATENQVIRFYNTLYELLLTEGLEAGRTRASNKLLVPITYDVPQWLIDSYTGVMDTDGDGEITEMDATFSDPAAVRTATQTVVDSLDLYLCGGRLQANSADIIATSGVDNDPYTILIDGLVLIMADYDHTTSDLAIEARDERIREALFLIGTLPECLVQQ